LTCLRSHSLVLIFKPQPNWCRRFDSYAILQPYCVHVQLIWQKLCKHTSVLQLLYAVIFVTEFVQSVVFACVMNYLFSVHQLYIAIVLDITFVPQILLFTCAVVFSTVSSWICQINEVLTVVKLLKSRWWNSTFPPLPFHSLPFPSPTL